MIDYYEWLKPTLEDIEKQRARDNRNIAITSILLSSISIILSSITLLLLYLK